MFYIFLLYFLLFLSLIHGFFFSPFSKRGMIVDIKPSPLKNKRYRATILKNDGTKQLIDFGLKGGTTYIDGRTNKEKENYLKRHLANSTENKLINNLIPSASLLSSKLLWGPSKSLDKNINELNKLWKLKHK